MQTAFNKISGNNSPARWARFFHSGTEWMEAYDIIKNEQRKVGASTWLPYVDSYMLGFALELFIKSIAAHEDPSFNPHKYNHSSTRIICEYVNCIHIFDKITKDTKLFELIKIFEKTVNTKFGDTYIYINGDDENLVSNCAFEIRKEMCNRTGLR